jgi:hypothetical protein
VVKKLLTFFSIKKTRPKKNPAKRPGYKGGTGLGMPVPMARKRERAGLRRATAYSQKSTSFLIS